MPFTIRSLFQQGNNEGQTTGATGLMEPPTAQNTNQFNGGMPPTMSSPFGMAVPPPSPFGGSLFKTREGESAGGAPVQQAPATGGSPFSPAGAGQPAGLTVGDVLPQLPPEMVRANSLPADQPVAIAPQWIEAALSTGQASIPIFEIYRVCPAIFQMPVSPQDTRQISLPPAKLPALIAAARNSMQVPSPFAQTTPQEMPAAQSPFSPFGGTPADKFGAAPVADAPAAGRAPSMLPPRRENGMPPPMPGAASPAASPFSATPPSNHGTQPAASPFGAVSPFAANPAAPPAASAQSSPFSFQSATPSPLPGAFAEATPPAQEPKAPEMRLDPPFGAASPQMPGAAPSPFAMSAPANQAAPSPFGVMPFGQGNPGGQADPQPFALTEPEPAPQNQPPPVSPFQVSPAPPAEFVPSPFQSTAPTQSPAPAAADGGPLKLSLATLLKGYSSTDLGFDPAMVPSWIMTSVSSSVIKEQMSSGQVQVELGQLIEGTTDIGFRNVLSGARRNLPIKLPANELFHSLPAAPPQQPPSLPQHPQHQQAQQPTPPLQFQQPQQFTTPAQEAPRMTASQPLNPFATAKAALSGPLQPSGTAGVVSGPIQPKPNANFSFALPTPAPLPEAGNQATEQPKAVTSFDPFAMPTAPSWGGQAVPVAFPQPQTSEGFSSDQLFGSPKPKAQPDPMPMMPEPQAPSLAGQTPRTFAALPGIPPPPSGSQFLTGTALQSPAPQPSFLPPPVLNPFSGPLKAEPAAPPVLPPAQPPAAQPFAFQAPTSPPQTPAPAASPQPPAPPSSANSMLDIKPVAIGNAEQVMLRALLGVNENLNADRVVDLISKIPGVAACSCVNGSSAVSHGGSSQTAQDFQRQAGDLARSIHALAPLIGIAGAETFSINTNERLMTFSFHPPIALGVLHEDNDLAAGLRDKITLVGRELARMVAKTSGHLS